MDLRLTETQRVELEATAAAEKRLGAPPAPQAVLLLAAGQTPVAVAQALRCSRAGVYAWAASWRQDGVAGLDEGDHGGGQVKLGPGAEGVLTTVPATDRQGHGHQARW